MAESLEATEASRHRWLPWAALGLIGATLVALMPFGVGYLEDGPRGVLERNLPWVRESGGRYLARLSGLLGSLLMFLAWWRLRPSPAGAAAPFRWIGFVWTIPFWPVPALMTADAYAYAAQGWLLHQGLNPYVFVMGYPSPFAESVFPAWRSTTAVYPPLALHLQHLVVDLAGAHPYWAPVAMRLLGLVGVGLMVVMTAPLARQVGTPVPGALWLIAVNPLLLIQFVGGAHNDALMVGLIMLALWLARRRWGLITSCAVIGIAAAIKQPAALAGAAVVLHGMSPPRADPMAGRGAAEISTADHDQLDNPVEQSPASRFLRGATVVNPIPWPALLGRLIIGGLIGGVTFVLLSIPGGLWFGWLSDDAGSPSLVINHSPLSWLAQGALTVGVPDAAVNLALTLVSALLMLAAFVWVARRWAWASPMRFAAGILLAFGLLGSAIQPWYVLWGGPLLAFCHPSRRVVKLIGAVVLLLLVSGVLQEYLSPVFTVPIGAVLAYAWWRWGARVTGVAQHR